DGSDSMRIVDRVAPMRTLEFLAGISIEVQLGESMPDCARKQHGFLEWREAAIGVEGDVRELGTAVAADATSGQAGELHIEYFWNNRDEDRAANPFSSGLIVVVLKASAEWERWIRGGCGRAERIDDSVGKLAEDAKGFHMDGSVGNGRLPGYLADEVGHLIERYRIGVIKQRSAKYGGLGERAGAGCDCVDDGGAVKERTRTRRGAESGRGIFRRQGEPCVLGYVLHEPDLRGALP